MDLKRREFATWLTLGSLSLWACSTKEPSLSDRAFVPKTTKPTRDGNDILLVTYPGMTAFDLIGPLNGLIGLSMKGCRCHLVGKSTAPVATDTSFGMTPTLTFDEAPKKAKIILFPGGSEGTLAAMQDPALLRWLKDRVDTTEYIGSVCTGALILGAAGLLKGKKAITHWAIHEYLALFGALPTKGRYVIDGQIVTGGGVSAGVDLGLALTKKIGGLELAQATQLLMEYAPTPPLQSGSPETAPPKIVRQLRTMYAPFVDELKKIAHKQKID